MIVTLFMDLFALFLEEINLNECSQKAMKSIKVYKCIKYITIIVRNTFFSLNVKR